MGLTPKMQDATLRRFVGGYPTGYTDIAIKCRLDDRIIRSSDGTRIISRSQIIMDEVVTTKDKITFETTEYVVIDVDVIRGIGGQILEYVAYL